MATPVTSLARLLSAVLEHPDWQKDLPRMARGLMASQESGAWRITTENVLAPLALLYHSRRFEPERANGNIVAQSGTAPSLSVALPEPGETSTALLEWPLEAGELPLSYEGEGRAWVTLRAQARMALVEPRGTIYRITRRLEPVHQQTPGTWVTGDIYRVELEIHCRDGANWVVLDDPVPAAPPLKARMYARLPVLIIGLVTGAIAATAAVVVVRGAATDSAPLPTFKMVREAHRPSDIQLFDRTGALIGEGPTRRSSG